MGSQTTITTKHQSNLWKTQPLTTIAAPIIIHNNDNKHWDDKQMHGSRIISIIIMMNLNGEKPINDQHCMMTYGLCWHQKICNWKFRANFIIAENTHSDREMPEPRQ